MFRNLVATIFLCGFPGFFCFLFCGACLLGSLFHSELLVKFLYERQIHGQLYCYGSTACFSAASLAVIHRNLLSFCLPLPDSFQLVARDWAENESLLGVFWLCFFSFFYPVTVFAFGLFLLPLLGVGSS